MRIKSFRSKLICAVLLLCACQLLFWTPNTSAYEVDLDYYDALTLDTVTPKGIYKRVVMFIKAPREVLNQINSVRYRLEGDFYTPQVTVRSRHNAFQFEVNTVTHIPVTVFIYFSNGKMVQLDRYILLGTRKRQREKSYDVHLHHLITKTPDRTRGETAYEMDLQIEGPENDLKKLDYVEYYFSKPYPKRMVKVSNKIPHCKYHIKTSKQVDVQAYVYFKDGTVIQLIRFIYFKYY